MALDQYRREDARWKILRVIDAGRPVGVNESIVRRVLSDRDLPFSQADLRRELAYLRDLGLIEVGEADGEQFAKATAAGVAVIEYTAPAPAGIARPAKVVA
jgi:hypothetical protein